MVIAIKGTWTINPTGSPRCVHVLGFGSAQQYTGPLMLMGIMWDNIS